MATQFAFGKIVTDGLTAVLDANDRNSYAGSGIVWRDLGPNSNNGTIYNNPGFLSSSLYYFDFTSNTSGSAGTFQSVTLPTTAVPNSGSFTIEAWINRNASALPLTDRESIFSNAGGADGFRFQIASSTSLNYLIGGAAGAGYSEGPVGSGYAVADGQWHQVAMVFDRAAQLGSYSVNSFTDGTFRASVSISSTNVAFTQYTPGISYGCCTNYRGRIAKLSVYNRALRASEILQNYDAQKSRFGL